MTTFTARNPDHVITSLSWKDFDEKIQQIAHGELSESINYDAESPQIEFLKTIDFIKVTKNELATHEWKIKKKELLLSLTNRGKSYYTEKHVKNNETEAKVILGESLKLHPAIILISQILSGSKNIKRVNVYNLLKHHNFSLNFQKEVELNNFLEILKLGEVISYNKNTRDVKVLWKQDIETLSSYQFISPEAPYSNIKRLKDVIKSLNGTVYWIDKHFDKKAFDILLDSLDAAKIIHFIIISGDANKTQSAVSDFIRFKNELQNKGINIEWKIITDPNVLSRFHDRWLCDSNVAWNIPPVNSILKGQESEMLKTSNKPNINKLLKNAIPVA